MDDSLHTNVPIPKWFLWAVGMGVGLLVVVAGAAVPFANRVVSELSSIKTQLLYQGQEFGRRIDRNEVRIDQNTQWLRELEREVSRQRVSRDKPTAPNQVDLFDLPSYLPGNYLWRVGDGLADRELGHPGGDRGRAVESRESDHSPDPQPAGR